MMQYFRRAVDDIFKNRFLNLVTIITISLSILIVSSFILFFINTEAVINSWKKGLRIMVYLQPQVSVTRLEELKHIIGSIDGVDRLQFIPKQEALRRLKAQMKHQASLFESLEENPLPDSIEIRMTPVAESWQKIESVSARIESLPGIEEVEYGQRWFSRFAYIASLFRLAGYGMGGLFFMAIVFIVANTIRLVIYSRREEVEIMRLVGATDNFIKIPFYLEGLIQGALGALMGLAVLFAFFVFVVSNMDQGFFPDLFHLQFLSPPLVAGIIFSSMLVSWLGCYISLKQFLSA